MASGNGGGHGSGGGAGGPGRQNYDLEQIWGDGPAFGSGGEFVPGVIG